MDSKTGEQGILLISDWGRQFSDTTIMMHEAIASKAGLSGTDHKYLSLLTRNGAMTAGELSKATGLTTGAVTGLIDRFEKKKLAKRAFDKADRRKILIVPNKENIAKLLGESSANLQSKMVQMISTLSESEARIIEKFMLSAIDAMKEFTTELKAKNEYDSKLPE